MPAQAPYGLFYPLLLAPGWLVGFDEPGMLLWARGVNALAGALLGTPLNLSESATYALLGGYVQFTVDSRTAQLVGALRARLDELLAAKLADARLDVGPGGREIVHAIDELLRSESARADARRDYERQELERRTAERRQRREGRYQRQEQRY